MIGQSWIACFCTSATFSYGNALLSRGGEMTRFDGQGSECTVTNASQSVIGTLTLSTVDITEPDASEPVSGRYCRAGCSAPTGLPAISQDFVRLLT